MVVEMTKEEPARDVASPEEFSATLTALGNADLFKLKQLARLRSFGLVSMEWEDLLNEAISRTLAGQRRWPRGVEFLAFMAQTMRSIANEEWRKLEQSDLTLECDLPGEDDRGGLADLATNPITPERELLARRALDEINRVFDDDEQALKVLMALAQGGSPEELMAESSLTVGEYATVQRRIRRKLAKHFS